MRNIIKQFINPFILIIALLLSLDACCYGKDDLADLKELIQFKKEIKDIKQLNNIYAIYLENLKQQYPHIFIKITLADNATSMALFREIYNEATNPIAKVNLIKNKFKIK